MVERKTFFDAIGNHLVKPLFGPIDQAAFKWKNCASWLLAIMPYSGGVKWGQEKEERNSDYVITEDERRNGVGGVLEGGLDVD